MTDVFFNSSGGAKAEMDSQQIRINFGLLN